MSDFDTPWTCRDFGDAVHIRNARGAFIGSMLAHGKLVIRAPDMVDLLREARVQIEYLHGRFQETGSGNAVLARIDALLAEIAPTPDIHAAFRAETESALGDGS